MSMRERCPILKCDWFNSKHKREAIKITVREKKIDKYVKKFDALKETLDRILEKL
jgi:hypothetical protein